MRNTGRWLESLVRTLQKTVQEYIYNTAFVLSKKYSLLFFLCSNSTL